MPICTWMLDKDNKARISVRRIALSPRSPTDAPFKLSQIKNSNGRMSNSQTILVVDDDPQIRDVLSLALGRAGFDIVMARDGAEGLEKANNSDLSLAVLDIGLPEMDGLELCKAIRRTSDLPILFLTARDDEVDRILGLELGGDDYVTKPFSPRELVARVRAILKRASANPDSGADPMSAQTLTIGVLSLVPESHVCKVGETDVTLTSTELSILEKLMSRSTQVFSRPALVDAIWGPGMVVSDRTLDSHLRNLRSKLAEAGCPDAVETLHGVGLRMGPCRGT